MYGFHKEQWVKRDRPKLHILIAQTNVSKVGLFGERSLRRAPSEYVEHFHAERNHQGKGNVLLFSRSANTRRDGMFNAASDWAACYVITIRRQLYRLHPQTETKKNGKAMRIKEVRQELLQYGGRRCY